MVGSARSLYRYSILGLAMLVPDRLCLALWPVLSGALSVGRRLWSLMRLHAKIAEHRVTAGDMVE